MIEWTDVWMVDRACFSPVSPNDNTSPLLSGLAVLVLRKPVLQSRRPPSCPLPGSLAPAQPPLPKQSPVVTAVWAGDSGESPHRFTVVVLRPLIRPTGQPGSQHSSQPPKADGQSPTCLLEQTVLCREPARKRQIGCKNQTLSPTSLLPGEERWRGWLA